MILTALAHADAPLHVHPETLALVAVAALAAAALAIRALARRRG
jgi:hypothetical protein